MLEFTLIIMLATSHGAAIEEVRFETEALCLDVITQMADKNEVYKKAGWNLSVTCARTGG